MSLKAGHLILIAGTMLAASVTAWHQDEKQRRKAKSEREHDAQQQDSIEHALREIDALCDTIDMLRASLEENQQQHVASDVAAYVQSTADLHQQRAHFKDRFQQQQRAFREASKRWKKQPLTYQGGHFQELDVAALHDTARHLAHSGEALLRLAHERDETVQLHQEKKDAPEAAQLARARMQARLDELEQLPHNIFAPGRYAALMQRAADVERQIEQQAYAAAYEAAIQVIDHARDTHQQVHSALQAWEQRRAAAQRAYTQLQHAVRAADHDFLMHWAPQQWEKIQRDTETVGQQLAAQDRPTASETSVAPLLDHIEQIQQEISDADIAAQQRYEADIQRKALVSQLITVLEELGFAVDAELRDAQNPTGEVVIAADRASGQEVQMTVDLTHQIQLAMDDGVKGADCVREVRQIMEKLQETGVALTIDDWGEIPPERLDAEERKSSPLEQRQSNQRADSGHV
jgi:hypothetical protein